MARPQINLPSATALSLALSVCAVASAQTAPAADKAATKMAPKPAKAAKAAAKPVASTPPAASPEQIEAAGRVFYGEYTCELNQSINIAINEKYPGYVDVQHVKAVYVMKPVVSSTGAVRLEDVKGETLLVQIANKSMLLNTKTGHRLVDDCESSKQREWNATAKANQAGGMAPSGASMFNAPAK